MKYFLTLFLSILPFALHAQPIPRYAVTEAEYEAFPHDYNTFMEVLGYYQQFVRDGTDERMNDVQKAFTYYYLVDAMIKDGGGFSALMQTQGAYNAAYLEALQHAADDEALQNYAQMVTVYESQESALGERNPPAEFDAQDDAYDAVLQSRVEAIESAWYEQLESRDARFKRFVEANREALLTVAADTLGR